ncbi:hypothetical protein MSG28_009844 [Choristoneura fumiferana]|uniref:Uncharacterized protein n=1 Tax=Choristoneura fumiferana TaxID=7141 RepID=A0ACC0JCX1_CHOFU|nr:hypothetical protein MSG28_009844 [Choristoneura fumiferana]
MGAPHGVTTVEVTLNKKWSGKGGQDGVTLHFGTFEELIFLQNIKNNNTIMASESSSAVLDLNDDPTEDSEAPSVTETQDSPLIMEHGYDIAVKVDAPMKQLSTLETFVTYRVRCVCARWPSPPRVRRRYNHFKVMIQELSDVSLQVVLEMNLEKTKIMTNMDGNTVSITINQTTVDQIKVSADQKARIFNQCILPVLTYGAETWVFTKDVINRLQVAQRAVEKKLSGPISDIGSDICILAAPSDAHGLSDDNGHQNKTFDDVEKELTQHYAAGRMLASSIFSYTSIPCTKTSSGKLSSRWCGDGAARRAGAKFSACAPPRRNRASVVAGIVPTMRKKYIILPNIADTLGCALGSADLPPPPPCRSTRLTCVCMWCCSSARTGTAQHHQYGH